MTTKLSPYYYKKECFGPWMQRCVDGEIDGEIKAKQHKHKVITGQTNEQQRYKHEAFCVFDRDWKGMLNLHGLFLKITDAEKREEMVLKNKRVILHCMRKYINSYNNYFQLIGRGRLDVDSLKEEFPLFESVFQDLVRKKESVKRNTFSSVKRGQSR